MGESYQQMRQGPEWRRKETKLPATKTAALFQKRTISNLGKISSRTGECVDRPFPAYKGEEPYIFVCYAHEDSDVVYQCDDRSGGKARAEPKGDIDQDEQTSHQERSRSRGAQLRADPGTDEFYALYV